LTPGVYHGGAAGPSGRGPGASPAGGGGTDLAHQLAGMRVSGSPGGGGGGGGAAASSSSDDDDASNPYDTDFLGEEDDDEEDDASAYASPARPGSRGGLGGGGDSQPFSPPPRHPWSPAPGSSPLSPSPLQESTSSRGGPVCSVFGGNGEGASPLLATVRSVPHAAGSPDGPADGATHARVVAGQLPSVSVSASPAQSPRRMGGAPRSPALSAGGAPSSAPEVDDEEDDDYEDDFELDDEEREEDLRGVLAAQTATCIDMVGSDAYDKLHDLLKSNKIDEGTVTDLSRLVFQIIPHDKSEAIQMMYKLLYLENQLQGGASTDSLGGAADEHKG
jgi:hypothetical protein